ncbi:hypothetical protein SYNTR_1173 [Candidatus Syntrophocurvum alkaliphilum]|uniref:Uncharacterized protein n=1 Tax=Candidatus Syntrophocurvum alkaliphilum TaxID=2293317 RepID=A0A6I6DF00_9FIRM|nr:hypothetical protein SYNTR_1173 [Candidatus Syntrophocurvum alkaliphilum]
MNNQYIKKKQNITLITNSILFMIRGRLRYSSCQATTELKDGQVFRRNGETGIVEIID